MFRFVKKATSKATTATVNKTAKVFNTDEIKENAVSAVSTAKAFWATRKGTDRRETFANAVARRGLTEDDLAALYRQHTFIAYLTLTFAVVAASIGASHALDGSLGGFLAALGAWFAMAGFFFRASFRAMQLDRRELHGVSVWVRNPLDWVPGWTYEPLPAGKGVRRV
jgi:hypothetical protein